MKERGIIMSGDNPRLILEGRKTQTRRIVNPQPPRSEWTRVKEYADYGMSEVSTGYFMRCPYGVAGDRLYVREMFEIRAYGAISDAELRYSDGRTDYRMIGSDDTGKNYRPRNWRKIPSIHMPRWASRITLEITKVRVERLQDISEEDASAEGIQMDCSGSSRYPSKRPYTRGFQRLWDSLHGKGEWDKNPWVWVIDFKNVACPKAVESTTAPASTPKPDPE